MGNLKRYTAHVLPDSLEGKAKTIKRYVGKEVIFFGRRFGQKYAEDNESRSEFDVYFRGKIGNIYQSSIGIPILDIHNKGNKKVLRLDDLGKEMLVLDE